MFSKVIRNLVLPIPSKYDGFAFFRSADANREFCDKGFVILDMGSHQVLDGLASAYAELRMELTGSLENEFRNTSQLNDNDLKSRVKEALMKYEKDLFSSLINDHVEVEPGSFFNKAANSESATGLHHDGCHIDEANLCGVHAWIPLQDMAENNGTFWIVPYSHRIGHYNRQVSDTSILDGHKAVLSSMLELVNIKRGQILFFDHALVHLSGANRSDQERTAASYTMAKRPFSYVYLKKQVNGALLDVFAVDRNFWIDQRPDSERLAGMKPIESRNADDTSLIERNIRRLKIVNNYLK